MLDLEILSWLSKAAFRIINKWQSTYLIGVLHTVQKHKRESCSGGFFNFLFFAVIKYILSLLMIDGDVRPVALLVGVVNKDKASMSCYQPPSHFVCWSSRVKRELWDTGWYGSVRINDQITAHHNAISLRLPPSLSHSHAVIMWHSLPGDDRNKGRKHCR